MPNVLRDRFDGSKSRLKAMATTVLASALLLTGSGAAAQAAPQPESGPTAGGTLVTDSFEGIAFTQVSAGNGHSLAIGEDGNAYAWGSNYYGELGDGTQTDRAAPVLVDAPDGVTFKQISAGFAFSLALGSDGNAYIWGSTSTGFGVGTSGRHLTPFKVQGPAGVSFTQIDAGSYHSLAVGSDGNTYAWGTGSSGELGEGASVNRDLPVMVKAPAGITFTEVRAGDQFSLAIGSDGNTYAWGLNYEGRLGDGTGTNRSTPVLVHAPAGVAFTDISAGFEHSLAIGSDGNTYAWGLGYAGKLGDGTNTNRSAPVQVQAPSEVTFTHVSASRMNSTAIGTDGNTYTWGSSSAGQLGNGTITTSSYTPVSVAAPSGVAFTQISSGREFVLAVGNDGHSYAWGSNQSGRLGAGLEGGWRTTPVQVSSGITIDQVLFGGVPGTDLTQTGTSWTAVAPAGCGVVDIQVVFTQHGAQHTWTTENGFTQGQAPQVTANPEPLSAMQGDKATMSADASGDDAPTVQWQKLIDGAEWQDVAGATDRTFEVPTEVAGENTYRAVFTNCVGVAETSPATVAVDTLTLPDTEQQPVIANKTLPNGTVSNEYSASLTAAGKAPVTWTVTKGKLPAGLKLDNATGKLSGTPTKAGTFTFTVTAKNSVGSVSKVMSITVKPAAGESCTAPRSIAVFADTPLSHKFYKEIDWMECMKYSTGWRQPSGKPLYKPQDNLERQAMAAFIYRMEAPKNYIAPKVSPFADVQPGDSFYKEIAWMYESKLSTGYKEAAGKPTFRPHASLTREAMAAFVYRLEAPKNYTAPKTSPMADMKPGMSFYKEISWMYDVKLSTGNKTAAGKEYWPKDDLSRQAMAAFIYRLVLDYRN